MERGYVPSPIFRYLDTNGDGSGTKDSAGNYAAGAEIFYIQPTGRIRIYRMIIRIEDASGFDAGGYGSITPTAALTNGIIIRLQNDAGTLVDLTNGLPIKTNSQWANLCYDATLLSFGTGNDSLVIRWTFSRSGEPFYLDGGKNERLEVVINDDLSTVAAQYFMVQGQDGW